MDIDKVAKQPLSQENIVWSPEGCQGAKKSVCSETEVYDISFNTGIDVENGRDGFWKSLCLKMELESIERFPIGDTNQGSYTFAKHTSKSRPVVLFFDEGSVLINCDRFIVDDFIGMLRLLRDGRDKSISINS